MQKLELTWIGKDDAQEPLEPRILIENPQYSYGTVEETILPSGKPWHGNMLIHGDNLLALKSLVSMYAGKVKCIYIDPPYNTNAATEYYDDMVEHSYWLGLMRPRLELLRELLSSEGTIWMQINDDEQAYLKVLCDEIFGRSNFINMVSVNMKNIAGASGGGEDKRIKKNCEYILVYTKHYDSLKPFVGPYMLTEMYTYVQQYRLSGKSWHYNSVLVNKGEKQYLASTIDGDGNEIKIYRRIGVKTMSILQLMKEQDISEKEVYYRYGKYIYEAKDAQSSIRTRIVEAKNDNNIEDDIISIEYIPKTGKNKGSLYEQFYKGQQCRLFAWLKDISFEDDDILYKRDLLGTYWDLTGYINNLTKEGDVQFPMGKKPEKLISQIFEMCTVEGDIVLDSFLGSGTTAAVAHKMGRKYIGIELGNHAYTHCVPRLKKVTDGEDQGGITKSQNWQGGGGFKFYELAPSLLKQDEFGQMIINPEYNADQLAAAMAMQEGYTYSPDKDTYWKQGHGAEHDYIFTTTQFLTAETIDRIHEAMGEEESLLICCTAYQKEIKTRHGNITVKKIPKMLLGRCAFDKDNYNLNIIAAPTTDDIEDESEDEATI